MRKFSWQLSLLVASVTSLLLTVDIVEAGGVPPAVVSIENATNMEIAPMIWVTGTVIGRYDSKIAAEVEGTLQTILDAGDHVSKGDTIATIDASRYRLNVSQIQAEIKPVETMVAFYDKEAGRLEKLAEQNNAARNQLDETIANRDEAIATIQQIRARLALARDELERTDIKAPFTGIITERIKGPGERVDRGDEVVRLVDTGTLEIQAYIQRDSFIHMQPGELLDVTNDKGTENTRAPIKTLIPVGDTSSRLYEIRLENNNPAWTAGTAVKVAVPLAKKQTVLAVPRDALVIRQSGTVVYKINTDNTAVLVPVITGVANTTHIQVSGDIKADDRIVTRGNERLRPGQTVTVLNGPANNR